MNQYFYFYPLESVLHQLYALPERYNTVFIVGHNPVWTDLSDLFTTHDIIHLRTSGVVGIQFQVDWWEDLSTQNAKDFIELN